MERVPRCLSFVRSTAQIFQIVTKLDGTHFLSACALGSVAGRFRSMTAAIAGDIPGDPRCMPENRMVKTRG